MIAFFFCPDPNGLLHIANEDLAIANLSRFCAADNRRHGVGDLAIRDDKFHFEFRQKIDGIFAAALNLGMPLLSAESFYFRNGHSLDPELMEPILHFLEFERLDNGFDLLHVGEMVNAVTLPWPDSILQRFSMNGIDDGRGNPD